jgi:HEPN pEK499 p136
MKNLEALERLAAGGSDVHVVTQLVVSLLALIVFPKEKAGFGCAYKVPLDDLVLRGWPEWQHFVNKPPTLAKLLEHLRHAISHGNVHFSSEARQYEGVRLTFTNKLNGKETKWEGRISAQDLREFCNCLCEHISSLPASAE